LRIREVRMRKPLSRRSRFEAVQEKKMCEKKRVLFAWKAFTKAFRRY
jgi:hypothetical protein